MKISAKDNFIRDFKVCPRKTVFDCNTNTYMGKRLSTSYPSPEYFAELVFKRAFYTAYDKLLKKDVIGMKDKELIFIATKDVLSKKHFKEELRPELKSKYDQCLAIALQSFKKFFNRKYVSSFPTKISRNLKLKVDLKALVQSYYGVSLRGSYNMTINIPIYYTIDKFNFIELFIYPRDDEYIRANELLSLLFVLFYQVHSKKLKKIRIYNIKDGSSTNFYKPFFDLDNFMFDLKSILLSIEDKNYTRNFSKNNCIICKHHDMCYKGNNFFNKKKIDTISTKDIFDFRYSNRNKINL